MTPREIFGWLRICHLFTVVNKVYAGAEYIKVDRMVIGFSGQLDTCLRSAEAKAILLEKVRLWCMGKHLPVDIQDQPKSMVMFKIVIIKTEES